MSENREILRLENLTIGYKNKNSVKEVAKGINASLLKGELTCLIGPNGVGKSTLMRTICAFQQRLGGNVFIEDKELDFYPDSELAKKIGVVLTQRPQIQNMSVQELTALGRSPYTGFWGTLTKSDKEIVDNSLSIIGIECLKERMIQTLSDGERQKVMIAKAIAQQTPIICLDEPTAFLDFPTKIETMQMLQRLCKEQSKTVFLSSHDLELALQLSDKIWLMQHSGLTIGTPQEVAASGALSSFIEREGISFDKELLRVKICK